MAQDHFPGMSSTEAGSCLLDSVAHMVRGERIVVGDTRSQDGMVIVEPWDLPAGEIRDSLESAIQNTSDPEFCFWIQLTKHYSS